MNSIVLLVTIVLATSGALLGALSLAHLAWPSRRRHPAPETHMNGRKFWQRVAVTGVVSTVLVYAMTYFLSDYLFTTAKPAWWRMIIDAAVILFVYDIFYYLMHRFPMHKWRFMMRIHAVHHQSHRPIPIHALHLHPLENFLGIGLLLFTTWLLGPVHVYTFGLCFFVYSWLNIVTHAGMALPIPYLNMLSVKHDAHHKHMRAGNFATLSPLPDMIFGTAE